MGSGSSTGDMEKLIGVAIFDFSDNGLTGLKWVSDRFVKLSAGYKLCLIHIKLDPNNEDAWKMGDNLNWHIIESQFKAKMEEHALKDETLRAESNPKEYCNARVDKYQGYVQKINGYEKAVVGRMCTGGRDVAKTLQRVIKELGLDTLVLGCAGRNPSSLVTDLLKLELPGCAVVLANKDQDDKNTTLEFSAPLMLPPQATRANQTGAAAQPLQEQADRPNAAGRRESSAPAEGTNQSAANAAGS